MFVVTATISGFVAFGPILSEHTKAKVTTAPQPQQATLTTEKHPEVDSTNENRYTRLALQDTGFSFSDTGVSYWTLNQPKEKTPKEIHKQAQRRAQTASGNNPVITDTDKEEILWLARIIYSETKRAHEQRLVAWVVRNRVDTGYRGRSYAAVANRSDQFSGLNPTDSQYEHNMSRYWASQGESWKQALRIAKEVYLAPEKDRPFSVTTRHFYSPVAVETPRWARGREAVRTIKSSARSQPRFAFYARIR